MASQTNDLLEQINAALVTLSAPLASDDINNGWSEECKESTLKFLNSLRDGVSRGEVIPNLSIARSLDHWGVVGGEKFELAAKLGNQYNVWAKEKSIGHIDNNLKGS